MSDKNSTDDFEIDNYCQLNFIHYNSNGSQQLLIRTYERNGQIPRSSRILKHFSKQYLESLAQSLITKIFFCIAFYIFVYFYYQIVATKILGKMVNHSTLFMDLRKKNNGLWCIVFNTLMKSISIRKMVTE